MKEVKFILRICLERKIITLNRLLIKTLGNPSHLSFWYDEDAERLIISPAAKDDLDAYQIPKYFWNHTSCLCVISQRVFLQALLYRLKLETDSAAYLYHGVYTEINGVPATVFDMRSGEKSI